MELDERLAALPHAQAAYNLLQESREGTLAASPWMAPSPVAPDVRQVVDETAERAVSERWRRSSEARMSLT
jgi:DNA-binding transcriptional regulator PaaX